MMIDWEDANCYMHVFIDTTDIVKLEQATNSIKCQKIMFTSASHEFRTPLNAIINAFDLIAMKLVGIKSEINLLLDGNSGNGETLNMLVEGSERFVSMSKNSSTILLSLIEDILDLSKIEAGTFSTVITKFSIVDVLKEIHQVFEFQ